jgi:hypothetical protein
MDQLNAFFFSFEELSTNAQAISAENWITLIYIVARRGRAAAR